MRAERHERADGSSFSKVIPALQAEGHEAIAAQYGLDTLAGDVAAVKAHWQGSVARRSPSGTHAQAAPAADLFGHVPMLSNPAS